MYGTRTATARPIEAAPHLRLVESDVSVGRMPESRNYGPAIHHTPEEPQADVRVGVQAGCATQADVMNQGQQLIPCSNAMLAQPTFLASDRVKIPANGSQEVSLTPVEPGSVVDWSVADPSGLLVITKIKIGRVDLMQSGGLDTPSLNPDSRICKPQVPYPVTPWAGVKVTFRNDTNADIFVNVRMSFLPAGCTAPATAAIK